MAKKEAMDKASISIPRDKVEKRLIERLVAVGGSRDRSANYLIIEAIEQYLEREEAKE